MAINLGSTAISDLKLGSTQVNKVYLGSTEVWSAGSDPLSTDWGILYYYPFTITYNIIEAMECEAEITNLELFESYISQQEDTGEMRFMYEESEGGWKYGWESETVITTEDMPTTTGITVTLNEGSTFAEIMIERIVDTDTSATPIEVILTQSEYESLHSVETYNIGGTYVPRETIKAFIFGTEASTTPETFLAGSSVEQISFEYAENLTSINNTFLRNCGSFNQPLAIPDTVTSIGNFFLNGCVSFNQPLTIPDTVTSIGNRFLSGCSHFNQPITIPDALTSIGDDFLYWCNSFNQPIIIPNTVTSIGVSFLYNCYSMTSAITCNTPATVISTSDQTFSSSIATVACYTTGITLTGTYASAWKSRFPNRSTRPFRKLIIGS